MMFFICLVAGSLWFYSRVYVYWKYQKKFTFKLILFYVQLAILALTVWALVVQVEGVADDVRYRTLAHRMQRAEFMAQRGEYAELYTELSRNMDYEKEFDHLWEREALYSACNRYLVYQAAEEAKMEEVFSKKAGYYRQLLMGNGQQLQYQENDLYRRSFLEKAGLLEETQEKVEK